MTATVKYLLTDDVCERYAMSKRTVDELSRRGKLPHRILPGCRRRLYTAEELDLYDGGCPLETVKLANGGRHVRPLVDAPATKRKAARR